MQDNTQQKAGRYGESRVERRHKSMHANPPRGRNRRGRSVPRIKVHDAVAQGKKLLGAERLREEVGQ
eukprot:1056694-Prymnesium_polylepis.1